MTEYIDLSIFELFKIGPGPSSSHTIGPMNAGLDFRRRVLALAPFVLDEAQGVDVTLYGSLSATGQGHGTDRAVAAGLLGWQPESVDVNAFAELLRQGDRTAHMDLAGRCLDFRPEDVHYGPVQHDYPFANTLVIRLMGSSGPLLTMTYYSIGGGFIQWDGFEPPDRKPPVYPYRTMKDLRTILEKTGHNPAHIMIANEAAQFGTSAPDIEQGLDKILEVMEAAVTRGLAADGLLPGPLKLSRKAPLVLSEKEWERHLPDRMLIELNAYALAAAEENAAGGIVVTAPTLGAAGVIPSIVYYLKQKHHVSRKRLRNGLLTAAAIGFLIKHNASIAGAEVGCQGEVGSASAMAAGLLCTALGFGPDIAASAAEIALEHHLGLTCDPVMGFVQIPCVERNAMGAVKAYNAFILAAAGDPKRQKVEFDVVVQTMLQTGRDMSAKYKETSEGGLAVNLVEC